MQHTLLKGKRGLIMGVANDKSIAWGIAKACAESGAELAFAYLGAAQKKRVEPLAAEVGSGMVLPCDVADEASIDALFKEIEARWGRLNFLVHAVSHSDKSQLRGRYLDTTMDNFVNTMVVSTYSLTSVIRRAERLMPAGASCLTLTYYGAEEVLPHYNVMGVAKAALEASVRYLAEDLGPKGIRVNALSAGTVKTLAASGIGDFREILKWNAENAPLRRTVTQREIGRSALYLLSEFSSGVTGETHYVDAGYNIIGMRAVES